MATISGNTDTNVQTIVASNMTASSITGYSWSVSPQSLDKSRIGHGHDSHRQRALLERQLDQPVRGVVHRQTLTSSVVMTHE